MKYPFDPAALMSPADRERALDQLGVWFVESLVAAVDDPTAASAIMLAAIEAFYDIRASADQLRGIYAGHFFLVDAVGLDDTNRPVPWHVLREKVGDGPLERYQALFDAAEQRAR